jgi:hypothetical protein
LVLLFLFAGFSLLDGEWRGWRLLFCVPLAVAGFFQLSLSVVEVKDDVLMSHFVAPWGRLYFVLDRNEGYPFRRGEYPLLRFIRGLTVKQPTRGKRTK